MKLDVTNPLSGTSVNIAQPMSWLKLVGGAALLVIVYKFGSTVAGAVGAKLPGSLANFGQRPTVNDPFAGLRVWQ